MNSLNYNKWVKNIKEGDVVLLMESQQVYSNPIIFISWNGHSATNGYRAQYIYIPDYESSFGPWWKDKDEEEIKKEADKAWKKRIKDYKPGCMLATINANAEKKLFPFPKEFLTKNQLKFVKLIKQLHYYEY
tara:strand:+ start:1589 stop:1984 length:396 start_codon:yes stop_codon:yes gene_type:complete